MFRKLYLLPSSDEEAGSQWEADNMILGAYKNVVDWLKVLTGSD
jgi:hypothetical protein